MAKKNMDALLSNIMGEALIRPTDNPASPAVDTRPGESLQAKAVEKDVPWKHFSFICSVELADKVQAIAHKEGFSIRSLMEHMMRQTIEAYETKNGRVRKIRTKSVTEVL